MSMRSAAVGGGRYLDTSPHSSGYVSDPEEEERVGRVPTRFSPESGSRAVVEAPVEAVDLRFRRIASQTCDCLCNSEAGGLDARE